MSLGCTGMMLGHTGMVTRLTEMHWIELGCTGMYWNALEWH